MFWAWWWCCKITSQPLRSFASRFFYAACRWEHGTTASCACLSVNTANESPSHHFICSMSCTEPQECCCERSEQQQACNNYDGHQRRNCSQGLLAVTRFIKATDTEVIILATVGKGYDSWIVPREACVRASMRANYIMLIVHRSLFSNCLRHKSWQRITLTPNFI